jgi:hypothetical protein
MDSQADASDSGMDSTVPQDSAVDSAPKDSTTDAPLDAPEDAPTDVHEEEGSTPALHPCTVAGDTNCVQCQGNTNNLCTPTEVKIVQHDIDKGLATVPGPDPMNCPLGMGMPCNAGTSCYGCLFNFTCIDDTSFGDTDKECEDAVITIGTDAECLTIVNCVFQNKCANPQISDCYCGSAPTLGSCSANPSGENGVCASEEAAGLGYAVADGTDIINHFTAGNRSGGVANALFNCAINNGCTMCTQ